MTAKTTKKFSPEVRERAVRMVLGHQGEHASQWAAIGSIAPKIGCSAETLRGWVRQAERDQGLRAGIALTRSTFEVLGIDPEDCGRLECRQRTTLAPKSTHARFLP